MIHPAVLIAFLTVAPPVPAASATPAVTASVTDTLPLTVPAVCDRELPVTNGNGPGAADCALTALRVTESEAPLLDGRLDDAVWLSAQPATGFLQQDPTPGEPSSQRTEARVLVTEQAVYVGMRLFDSNPALIRAQFVRRDDDQAVSDWASVMFDSYYDRRTAFEFATTPTGTRVDILHLDDTEVDVAWDAVWEVVTGQDADGWVAEFRIPLSQLRFAGGEDVTWGINFGRKIARRSEVAYWAPIPPTAGRSVSLYGDLVGLDNISAPGGLELLPYTVGRLTRAPGDAGNPFYRVNDGWGSGGLDLKYGLTSNLTLTATVNPDFGQVEADPSQVNLTAFETFYAEKRPFFTEGTEIFNFRLLPEGYAFYSRRIGRAPQIGATVSPGGYADAPETAPILGALKLSGKTSGGWSVGLMNAVTGRVTADVSELSGLESQPLEPLTNYAVGRLGRDFREGRSGIGILATAANRELNDSTFQARLRSASYTGALNWWHRFAANYEFNGWLLGTHAAGSAEAMARTQASASHFFVRSDADHLTYDPTITSMYGWASEWAIERIGGGNWTWNVGGGSRSPGVELNDLGFLSFGDVWYGSVTSRYSRFDAGSIFRNWYAEGQYVRASTFGNELIRNSVHLRTRATLLNFWQVEVNTDRWFERQWPWELRGGPAITQSPYTFVRWFLRSDSRRPWNANLRGTVSVDDQGGSRRIRFDPLINFRPTQRATVSLGPILEWNRDSDQYVARATAIGGESEYVVGRVSQKTAAVEARVSYGFSPTLNLDVYAQPFLSTGSYTDFRTVEQANASDFDERIPLIPASTLALDPTTNRYGTPAFDFRNPDFNVREFRVNAVLRWEYRPGSSLFLVWTQARADNAVMGDFDLGRDFDQLFQAPATNIFMVKVNYWIGL